MAEFIENDIGSMDDVIDFGLLETVLFLQQKIIEIAPRDFLRLPQNINRKDGRKPHRSGQSPVMIGGNWYTGVTGNLKRSIGHEKITNFFFLIGVKRGPAMAYARAQEFGTVYMPPRSFIRKGIFDNLQQAKKIFKKAVAFKLNK